MGTVIDRQNKTEPKVLNSEHLHFIDDAMADNDELTARRLRDLLEEELPGLKVSIAIIKRVRKHNLGWILSHPKYC